MHPWPAIAALSGFVTAIMTSQIAANAQGELQGVFSSVNSITSIIGPLVMTQLFAAFTAPSAPAYFPGVSFLAAAVLSALCLCIFIPLVRSHQSTALGKALTELRCLPRQFSLRAFKQLSGVSFQRYTGFTQRQPIPLKPLYLVAFSLTLLSLNGYI
jgi:MFS family permease